MTQEPRFGARHVAIGLLVAVLGVALVVTGVGRLAGFGDLRETLAGADPVWLFGCALGQVLVFAGYAGVLRRAIAVDDGPRVDVGFSLRLALASFAATQLFSLAGVAGLAIVYWALRRLGRDRQDAAVVLIGLNTCVYLVFGAIGWAAALAALLTGQAQPGMTVPWLIGIPVVIAAAQSWTAAYACARGEPGAGIRPAAMVVGAAPCADMEGMASAAGGDGNLCEVHCQATPLPSAGFGAFAPSPDAPAVVAPSLADACGVPADAPDAKGAAPPARQRYCRLQL